MIKIILLLFVLSTFFQVTHAVPIDWNGSFVVDSTRINQYRRTTKPATAPIGSTIVDPSGPDTSVFQSYVLKLNPHVIINDGVSLKGLLTTGHGMGGFLGDNTTNAQASSINGLLYNSTPQGNSNLDVAQFYAELYSDAGLYRVGRFAKHWGMGAVLNAGLNNDDRFFTLYDGIDMEFKIGKFLVTPYFAKISTANALNRAGGIQEIGVSAVFDNPDTDMKMGILYSKRSIGSQSGLKAIDSNPADFENDTHPIGGAEIKLIDVYAEKKWGKLGLKLEVPIFSGDAGDIYGTNTTQTFKAKAQLIDLNYQKSLTWNFGLLAGSVTGASGQGNSFEGMYLNPNFNIAEVMFRYNMHAVNDRNQSIFDASVTNATFAKIYAQYKSENTGWNFAFIYAKAQEVAQAGQSFYQHERAHQVTNANTSQSNDLGYEIDVSFDYYWNPTVTITGFLGYQFVGDYYAFTNDTNVSVSTKNAYAAGVRMAVGF